MSVIKQYETERPYSSDTTHLLYIDGFNRQANNTLRRLVLNAFPTISITKPLRHSVDGFKDAIACDQITIATLRHPLDAINSLCGYKKMDTSDFDQIKSFLGGYRYLYEYLFKNKNLITFVKFEDIIINPSKILYYFENKFLIKKNKIKKYKDLSLTPFFTSFNKDGIDNHNLTSTLENEKSLNWMLKDQKYIEAEILYDKLLLQSINLSELL